MATITTIRHGHPLQRQLQNLLQSQLQLRQLRNCRPNRAHDAERLSPFELAVPSDHQPTDSQAVTDWPPSELFARFPDLVDAAMARGAPTRAEVFQLERIQQDYLESQRQNVLHSSIIANLSNSIMQMHDDSVAQSPAIEVGSWAPESPLQRELLIELELLMDELWLTDEVAQELQHPAANELQRNGIQDGQLETHGPVASQVPIPGRLVEGCMTLSRGHEQLAAARAASNTRSWLTHEVRLTREHGTTPNTAEVEENPDAIAAALWVSLSEREDPSSVELWQLRQVLSIRERVSQTVQQLRRPKQVKLLPCAAAAA